jgi:site-specific DNA recombinase
MRVALYARVSSDGQAARGTVGSQVQALRAAAATADHTIVAEFVDDGYSGARLDRPGLDALRDHAEAGAFEVVWCLTPDRLARAYAYQVLVLDELARLGVTVRFVDAPPIDDDPQARLLVQMQGVIAEYERAKIAERHRRGKLYRVRAGEAVFWRVPYGYRRVPRSQACPAHLVVHEPEAAVVRRIFDDYVAGGLSMREISRRLYAQGVPSPTGKGVWPSSTMGGLLRNPAYAGTARWYRHETLPPDRPGGRPRRRRRPEADQVAVAVPAIIGVEVFEAAQRVSRANSDFSPRRATPGAWLLRGLVVCGPCGIKAACLQAPTSRGGGGHNRYYVCAYKDPLKAGGPQRRCRERQVRADELDAFVFQQVRQALLRPQVLLAGERELTGRAPVPDDELLAAELAHLQRRAEQAGAERRRLLDLYQAGLLELAELKRRVAEVQARQSRLGAQQAALTDQRAALAQDNRLRQRVGDFAAQARAGIDTLDFDGRQRLLRLVVEQVRVTGWQVEIRLRIPLDETPHGDDGTPRTTPRAPRTNRRRTAGSKVSTEDGLRSARAHRPRAVPGGARHSRRRA